jgi:hypothetical protein
VHRSEVYAALEEANRSAASPARDAVSTFAAQLAGRATPPPQEASPTETHVAP